MMKTRRSGFTLAELLVVSVLTAVTLAGVYQTLMVQEKSYEAAGHMIKDQESLRTALGILESELREIGSIGGSDIAGTDIDIAADDSIRFRAHRKTAFVCRISRSERWAVVWVLGDLIEAGDPIMVFVDNDSIQTSDDRWDTTTVTSVQDDSDTGCTGYWNTPLQRIKLDNQDLTGVRAGSPIRSYEWVTYSLYDFGPLGWGLGRNQPNSTPRYLVGGLAEPGQGLQFTYYDPTGAETNAVDRVARIRVTVKTDPEGNTSVEPTTMTSHLYLRNN